MFRLDREGLRLRLALLLLLGAVASGLSACTTNPAPTRGPKSVTDPLSREWQRARVAGQTPPVQPRVLSYCYSNLINTPEQIIVEATEDCDMIDGRLEYLGEDSLLTPCPLFQPVRATYLCHRQ